MYEQEYILNPVLTGKTGFNLVVLEMFLIKGPPKGVRERGVSR